MTTTSSDAGLLEPAATANATVQATGRLRRGVLSPTAIAAATLADMAPTMSFYFTFGAVAAATGVGSPLMMLIAALAIGLLAHSVNEFARRHPSAGSFVTFIGLGFGPAAAVATAYAVTLTYVVLISTIVAESGGWTRDMIARYLHVHIPWQLLTVVIVLAVFYLVVRGVVLSTRVVVIGLVIQGVILTTVCIALLIDHWDTLSLASLNPANLKDGFSGIGLAFPLAVYCFLGWENSAPMAEEAQNPRKAIPRATFGAIAVGAVIYVALAFVTVNAYGNDAAALAKSSLPFVDAGTGVSGFLAFLVYVGGLLSLIAVLMAGTNGQSRILFNSGREGLLPRYLAKLTPGSHTPWAAFATYLTIATGIVFVFGWNIEPEVFFGRTGTIGTIVLVCIYIVTNVSLPLYMRRVHPADFSIVRHLVMPLVAIAVAAYPLYQAVKPGQTPPFDVFPYISLAIIVGAVVVGVLKARSDPGIGARVGSIVADD